MSPVIWLIAFVFGTGLFVSAQTPTPTLEQNANLIKQTKADSLFAEAYTLFQQGTAESYQTSLDKFQQASQMYQEIESKSGQTGVSLLVSGTIYDRLDEKSSALKFYEQALKFFQTNKYPSWEATTLINISRAYSDLGDKQKALEYLNQALQLKRQIGDKSGEASTLNNIGLVYSDLI